ncbi:MAG: BatA domain-containing protein, partial [Bacteroidota bacterium]|nr:BatA domain-containing protein [Bacteroidota bacterium]
MLHFLQPIWLWASAGIIVPIIIHLWNVTQGKTLRVGSIAFLTENAKSHASSFKLSLLLLLLLRCLLIIVLSMLIAKPFYEQQVDLHKEKGWVLIDKNQINEAYKKYRSSIDSLLRAGFTFHYFNSGFEEARFEDVVKLMRDTTTSDISYWALLKQLDQKVPSTLPVFVFTDNSLRKFTGTRPAVSLNLVWHIYSGADTLVTWLQDAYQISTDSIRVALGFSVP